MIYLIICLCGGTLGELTKIWLLVLVVGLGISEVRGKAET